MKILLLGGTGYLGGNIAKHLAREGHDVICVVRRTSNINRLCQTHNVRLISNDSGQIELTLQQEKIDWVINGVCTYKPNTSLYEDMLEANIIFPLNVLNLAIKHQVKNFITLGSGLPEEFNVYSFTKSKFSDFGRYFSKLDDINFADLKLEMLYGGEYEPLERFINFCIHKMVLNEKLELTSGDQKRDIIRVEDIVGIIASILQSNYLKGYKALQVGTGEQHSIRTMIEYMNEQLHSSSELLFGAIPNRIGEPDTMSDITWLKELGYNLKYSYFEGLKQACIDAKIKARH